MIKKLLIKNFKGITDKVYTFEKEPFFLWGENGFGKTSFLEAIRFALTGKMPADMLYHGAESGYVAIQFNDADNTIIERQFFSSEKKPNKVKMNGKTCTGKAAQVVICDLMGCSLDRLQTITSHEVFLELINGDLGEFLRAFIFEELNRDLLFSLVPFDEDETDKLKRLIPTSFEVSMLDKFYEALFNERAEVKKAVQNLEAKFDLPEPETETTEEPPYYTDYEMLMKDEEKYLTAKALKKKVASDKAAYERALREYNNRKVVLDGLKRELALYISVKPIEESEVETIQEALDATQEAISVGKTALASNAATLNQQKKVLAALDSDACPISDCLVCKTDKTCVKAEIMDTIKSLEINNEDLNRTITNALSEAEKLREKLTSTRKLLKIYNDYLNLKTRVDEFVLGSEPMAPITTEIDEFDCDLFEARKIEYEQWCERESAKAIYENKTKELSMLNSLVKKFASKGVVTNAVMQHYCDIFDEQASAIADLFGYQISFIAEDGVKLIIKPTATKQEVSFSSLSRGEQLTVSIIIYAVLNMLMGTGIMVVDNFNDLDNDAAGRAYKIIKTIHEELCFDDIFIAGCFPTGE